MRFFIILAILFSPGVGHAQNSCYQQNLAGDTQEVFRRINIWPQFTGGSYAWNKFIGGHARFDKIEKLVPDPVNGFKDSITLQFIVSREGVLSNLQILQDGSEAVREEAI